MKADEVGITQEIEGLTVTATDGSDTLLPSTDITSLVFENDRIQLSSQSNEDEIYTVVGTDGSTSIILNKAVHLPSSSLSSLTVLRVIGGRGLSTNSLVACSDSADCSLARRKISGSMESKLEALSEAIQVGVEVDRDGPDETNGYTWRVTFLDNSPAEPYDFTLSVFSHELWTESSQLIGTVEVRPLVNGETYLSSCVGSVVVPGDRTLTLNKYYYARVFAINSIGFSFAQVAPSAQKPMVVPGPPTLVVLTAVSRSRLRVTFNPPISDGGDTITSYLIEYSIRSDFSSSQLQSVVLSDISNPAPYAIVLTDLAQGIPVFVRVKAGNSQGYGLPAASTPASLQPYEASDPPSNVKLYVTSNSMLTVTWSPPLNNGGDSVKSYIVEWDTVPEFNGIVSKPNKDSVTLSAAEFSSYTIASLTADRVYFVRVFAKNSAVDRSLPALAVPSSAAPSLQVPGKPHTITATSGSQSGEIFLTWQFPRIPWHGIPCSGTPLSPDDCPASIGGDEPSSNGGTEITEYLVEYNERSDFKGYDSGSVTTTGNSFTLQNLTPGRLYFIRILARNEKGSGQFCSFQNNNCLLLSSASAVRVTATATL
jgi:hypothetical protein